MSEPLVFGIDDTATFRHEGREFQATLRDDGTLHVCVTGQANGLMLVTPGSHTSISISSSRLGITRAENPQES